MSSEDPWVIVAAVATAVSAGVVAWQAVETRRSVRQARKSAEQAEISAQAARDAVTISQQILQESQIARIDAGVPRVIVTIADPDPGLVQEWTDRGVERILDGHEFTLPRDAKRQLFIGRRIEILNEGPGSVALTLQEPLKLPNESEITICTLAPGQGTGGIYRVIRPVQEWINIAESKETGHPGLEHTFSISHWGPRDAEAIEHIGVVTGGTLLQRAPDAPSSWQVTKPAVVNSVVTPAKRTYWQSRTKNLKFPES
jgi:hypothetical protein